MLAHQWQNTSHCTETLDTAALGHGAERWGWQEPRDNQRLRATFSPGRLGRCLRLCPLLPSASLFSQPHLPLASPGFQEDHLEMNTVCVTKDRKCPSPRPPGRPEPISAAHPSACTRSALRQRPVPTDRQTISNIISLFNNNDIKKAFLCSNKCTARNYINASQSRQGEKIMKNLTYD